MKITRFRCFAFFAAIAYGAGTASAQAPMVQAGQASAGQNSSATAHPSYFANVIPAAYSCGDSPICGCEIQADGCDGGCDSLGGGDDPWKLFPSGLLGLNQLNIGGWTSLGYHTYDNPGNFNQHSDRVRLHQAWLYAERVADGSSGFGLGGRIDYLYGVDAQDTQAFGYDDGHWDNGWDNGIYGHAIPQLYAEAAIGDKLKVKLGKFFTIIGNEVVGATGNFFYSQSYTMYNSEPFTHTGVLTEYALADDITLFNGWVTGWDSGFRDNGDAYLGGVSLKLTENTEWITSTVVGNFGKDGGDESGYMVSTLLKSSLSDKLTYIFWIDVLDTDRTGRAVERKTFDLNQSLLYQVSDNLAWGNRFEWYNVDKGVFGATASSDIYAYTTGLNYRIGKNLLFRPEVRWDWDKAGVIGLERGNVQTTFGSDAIFTF